jgi:hypothetical protein
MARGGKRPGAGRKPGTVSEATQRRKEVAERALAEGISPLDVMLTTMRTLWDQALDPDGRVVNLGKAMQANMVAKDAAPFLHPKLSSVEATGKDGAPLEHVHRIERVIVDPKA